METALLQVTFSCCKYAETQGWRFEVMEASYNGVGIKKWLPWFQDNQSTLNSNRIWSTPCATCAGKARSYSLNSNCLVVPVESRIRN